ncbi:MAG: DNA internalization-related competence protein ComEC/Rec2 [Clostridia bacterium]|nr:DNA internalization-related competence protein ComEC/Rec2 [Clostridia bacterium]
MKHASFTAAASLCIAALFLWSFPNAFIPVVSVLIVFVLLFVVLFLRFRNIWLRDLLFSLSCLLVSSLLLWFPVSDYYDTQAVYDGSTVTATVTLTEDPVLTSTGMYRYTVRPDSSLFSQRFIFFSPMYSADGGDELTASFTFSKPTDEYAYENLSEGVAFTAHLNTLPEDVEVVHDESALLSVSQKMRRYVRKTFLRFIGDSEGGFMTAVLTGNKEALSGNDYSVLKHTGMLHIVAVSGLHVSIFVTFVLFFLKKLRNLRLKILLSVLSLGIILLFSGITASVLRAVIMNLIVFGGEWFSARTDPLNRLGIAAAVILFAEPYAVFSLAFQLSFSATLGILLFSQPFTQSVLQWLFVRCHVICGRVLRNLISLFCVSVAAFLFTLPLLWLRLDTYSVWSLYLSPAILPVLQICFFAALLLLILSLFPFLSSVCAVLGFFIRYGVNFMTYLSSFAVSVMDMVESVPNALKWLIAGVFLILAGLLYFLPIKKTSKKNRRMIKRGFALVLLIISLLTVYQASESLSSRLSVGEAAPATGVLQTAFLDVGQGNCVVSILNEEAYVVDCGGTKKAGIVASDYLTAAGIETVKFVLISHLHDDHANGLKDLCAEKEVLEIIIPYTEGDAGLYAQIVTLAAEEDATLTVVEEDTRRTLGGSTLHLLSKHLDPTSDDQNENSIVGISEYGNYRGMFTGDITSRAEKRLVSAYGSALNCDVLSVPHHGSKSSSCDSFLVACSPIYAVVSVGSKNSYGHPTQEALGRLSKVGAIILRTDESSTVTVRTDGEKMEVLSANES